MFSSQNSQVSSAANYIEDVFSTYLYTGNGNNQTITNGIDLSGKGGMVWFKARSSAVNNTVVDTVRGGTNELSTNLTAAQVSGGGGTAFTSTGFSLDNYGSYYANNQFNVTYASWTFRKQPKFFDVVTYTGNATAGRTIAHNLGSVPGCIIVKRLNGADNWTVYHRGIDSVSPQNYIIYLNTTDARSDQDLWADTAPTDSVFSVGDNIKVNGSSSNTYVAYLFAHNAGGFGLTGTDNVISCGSWVGDGAAYGAEVNLGYEPQWLIQKDVTSGTEYWAVVDNMRGLAAETSGDSGDAILFPNATNAEINRGRINPTATGFIPRQLWNQSGNTYIYIAIRRGPMKVPTSGTSVFAPVTTASTAQFAVGFPADLGMLNIRGGSASFNTTVGDRLRGGAVKLLTSSTAAESTGYFDFTLQNDFKQSITGADAINYLFRRAPSFFDEVCYTGDGVSTGRAINHNLGVVPELMIIKWRNGSQGWYAYSAPVGNERTLFLNLTDAVSATSTGYWYNTTPTSTVFTLGSGPNQSSRLYVAYLFATCAGVSKVGSYTGTGTTLQVDCGFTGGARFVLIKRTDSTGDWYVWDSARGIVAGNDPYLLLNSTAAEVTSTDYVDTYSAGFEISSTAPAAINASGGSYIFLAVS